MKFKLIETKEILEYENELGVELIVHERENGPKYYVLFDHCEIMENDTLVGYYGNGNTVDEALIEYCEKISNKQLALFAGSKERMEVFCPKLVHTKLLGK